ncbi:cell division inhibitor SepF [Propionibacterium sp. oral taxon 192 str. F0372]|uniref:cell division protein SepF n=1 Tax=Propionibacterium sp. oral taxon 192 TaxID=671222 RepID=UPI0003542D46|nr:cell division protein SepF [Propionibacterium sp. oral taxon 192]EPH02622.1 cell division inhibitor SepF [Propionibacterium sp. oral taxon 192 str. F0372]
MPQFLRKAAAWIGLISDEEFTRYGDDVEQFSEPIYPDDSRIESARSAAKSSASSVRTVEVSEPEGPVQADLSRIITVHPRTYNEARTIGEHFREGVPVIMNLSEMEDADAKRLVDFAAGLIFGLRGTIERVTSKVFLLSPNNVNVTAEDKERIKGGFYNQS